MANPWTGPLALLHTVMKPATATSLAGSNNTAQYVRKVDLCNVRNITVDTLNATTFTATKSDFGSSNTGELTLGILSKQAPTTFTASYSTLIGVGVLGANQDHAAVASNVFMGFQAAFGSSNVTNSVYLGSSAAYNVDNASANVGIGWNVHGNATGAGGSNNVFVGAQAGFSNTANSNVFLGYRAGCNTTSGASNVFVGAGAGCNITTGASNVFIGAGAGTAYSATISNVFAVNNGSTNPLLYGNFATSQLGIGKVPASGVELDVSGDIQFSGTLSGTLINGTVLACNISGIIASSNVSGTYSNAAVFFSNISQRAVASFYSTVSQNCSGANLPIPLTYNTTTLSYGVSLSGNTYLKVTRAGNYKVAASIQFSKTDPGDDVVYVWLRKNGANLGDSASQVRLQGNGGETFPYVEFVLPLNANDAVEWYMWSPDSNIWAYAKTASGTDIPAIPSIVANIYQL